VAEFMAGAITVGSLVAGLFFFRFWHQTRDRFFLYFAASFWIEAVGRGALEQFPGISEHEWYYYVVRVVAYGLILVAIWQKNRSSR
jgi:hypothetical protein